MTRPYTRRTDVDRLNAILQRIARLEKAEAKRGTFIGQLRQKAQNLQNQIALDKAVNVPPQVEVPPQ